MQATKGVSSHPTPYVGKSHAEVSEGEFFKTFGVNQVKRIGCGEFVYSENWSITSYDIGDSITVFAVEKKGSSIEAIMGWHLGGGCSVEEIQLQLNEFADKDRNSNLYIIGGAQHTTEGPECLLANIKAAIEGFFIADVKILKELVSLNAGMREHFVSANLQMDGTLTYCRHVYAHGSGG